MQGHHSAADGSHLLSSLHRKVEPAQAHCTSYGDDRRGQAWHVSSTHTHTHTQTNTISPVAKLRVPLRFEAHSGAPTDRNVEAHTTHTSLRSRLVLGFMCCTVFLSMWLSNTSTTAMVMPIAEAVLQQLICTGLADSHNDSETAEDDGVMSGSVTTRKSY